MACALFPLLTVALTAEDERLRLDEGSLTEVTLSVEMVLFRLDTCSEVLTVVALGQWTLSTVGTRQEEASKVIDNHDAVVYMRTCTATDGRSI